jgi:hypothetical protein
MSSSRSLSGGYPSRFIKLDVASAGAGVQIDR